MNIVIIEHEDSAPVMVCCNCGGKFENDDGSPFKLDEWIICRHCLHPVIVTWFCDEDHAHTEVYVPDETTPEGRSDMLTAAREALRMMPDSDLADEHHEEFEKLMKETMHVLMKEVN